MKNSIKPSGSQIQLTLKNLEQAFEEWDQIPEGISEIDKLRQKTRDLIQKLNEQIKSFDL